MLPTRKKGWSPVGQAPSHVGDRRATQIQISDVFRRAMITHAQRVRCPAHAGSIFDVCVCVSLSLSFLVSSPTTMKSAMKCDKHCELQESCFFCMSGTPTKQKSMYDKWMRYRVVPNLPSNFRWARTTWPRLTDALHTYLFLLISNYIYIFGAFFLELIM